MNSFIKLTAIHSFNSEKIFAEIRINTRSITTYYKLEKDHFTRVFVNIGKEEESWYIRETPKEIDKLIESS
jgi:hypothetical protein